MEMQTRRKVEKRRFMGGSHRDERAEGSGTISHFLHQFNQTILPTVTWIPVRGGADEGFLFTKKPAAASPIRLSKTEERW